jgi:hypothetical protein
MDSRVACLEADVLMLLGPDRQSEERVDRLEASRGATAIEIGGVVFADKDATEAWVCTLGEESPHRFAVDMFSLFLLADPKYETV